MEEEFVEINGYDGDYLISNTGNVLSRKKTPYIILKTCLSKYGYFMVGLSKFGKFKLHSIHRLVAEHFLTNPFGKKCVNHKDCNKKNNHVFNLEWCTYQENSDHAREHKLLKGRRGKENCQNKLTISQVIQIKKRLLTETNLSQIGKEFKVSRTTIRSIKNNLTWTHINLEEYET